MASLVDETEAESAGEQPGEGEMGPIFMAMGWGDDKVTQIHTCNAV